MSIVPPSVAEDAKAEMQRLAAERYAPETHRRAAKINYTPALGAAICDRISNGESLLSICRDADMPARGSVLRWAASEDYVEFRDNFARAMQVSGDADHDEVSDIARQAARGEIDPAAARAAMDGLKWTAGKKAPKKYGDRQIIAGDKDAPLEFIATTDLERAKAVAALVGKVKK